MNQSNNYILIKKNESNLSAKELLNIAKLSSARPRECEITSASHGRYRHFDFYKICRALGLCHHTQRHFFIYAPDSNLSHLLLRITDEVKYYLSVSNKNFIDEKLALLIHQVDKSDYIFSINDRLKKLETSRSALSEYLEKYCKDLDIK